MVTSKENPGKRVLENEAPGFPNEAPVFQEEKQSKKEKKRIRNGKGQYVKGGLNQSVPFQNEKKKVSKMVQFFSSIIDRKFLYNLFHFIVGQGLGAVTPEGKRGRFLRLIRVIHYVSNLSGRLVLITIFFFLCKSIYLYMAPFIIPIIAPSEAASASYSFWKQTPPPQNFSLPSLPFYGYQKAEPSLSWGSLSKAMGWTKYIILPILLFLLIILIRRLFWGALNLFIYAVGWATPGDLRDLQYQVEKRADFATRIATSLANETTIMEQSIGKVAQNTEVGEEVMEVLETLKKESKEYRDMAVRMKASHKSLSRGLGLLGQKADDSSKAIYNILRALQERAIKQLEKAPIPMNVAREELIGEGPIEVERAPGEPQSEIEKQLKKWMKRFEERNKLSDKSRNSSRSGSPDSTTYGGYSFRNGKGPGAPGSTTYAGSHFRDGKGPNEAGTSGLGQQKE